MSIEDKALERLDIWKQLQFDGQKYTESELFIKLMHQGTFASMQRRPQSILRENERLYY